MTTLVLAAHGSTDPRSAAVTHAVAGRIRRLRPELDVRPAFLQRSAPSVCDVLAAVTAGGVVVPFLLGDAYHAGVDIPAMIEKSGAAVRQAEVLGDDPALVSVLRLRLAEAGVSPDEPGVGVIVVAVGSSDTAANARTALVTREVCVGTRWAGAAIAFATGPHRRVADAADELHAAGAGRVVLAPWFLAPGRLTDRVAAYADAHALSMSEPLGAEERVAMTVLQRYDAAARGLVA